MPEDSRNWFIGERSEALAGLLLTSKKNLRVRREEQRDDGSDFLVALDHDEGVSTKLFVVQVKGTLSTDKQQWAENVKPLYNAGNHFLPACVFVINVRSNDAVYAWLAEPQVNGSAAKLHFFDRPDFHRLDESAVDDIVQRVRGWCEAMPRAFVSQSP